MKTAPILLLITFLAGCTARPEPISNPFAGSSPWPDIRAERIPVVPLYFAAERPVVRRGGTWVMVDDDRMRLEPGERPQMRSVRFRTLGCYPLSGGIESTATTLDDVIAEMEQTRMSERQGRLIDTDSVGSMERKKQDGYF